MTDRTDDDLAERVEELEATLQDLQGELAAPPRGPLGLPRPPTPREVLSFTGEYALPTVISVLEANVRALKALQRIIEVTNPERATGDRSNLERRANDVSQATLSRLESALSDVETAISEGDLPREPEARRILEDARRINRDIADRLSNAADRSTDAGSERGGDGGSESETRDDAESDDAQLDDDAVQIDVDAEIQSIKDELNPDDDGDDEAGGDEDDGTDADGDEDDS